MKKQIVIIGAILVFCAIIISGCNEQKKPVISSFEVIPNQIEFGDAAALHWNVSEATSVTIDNGIGAVMLSGNRTITPLQTTTYTLTAKSATTTVTATTSIIVNQPLEKPNVSMIQSEFYIEITGIKNARVSQSQVYVIANNITSTENLTSALGPTINEGDGNPTSLGSGDIITFHNLSDFAVGELWNIQLLYRGDIVGQCIFKNPKGPYDRPIVRMIQSESNITIIGIINGPIEQTSCSIIVINTTSETNQTSVVGAALTDRDNKPSLLGVSDQITFSNLEKFKAGDTWTIQLVYKGDSIGQCTFINPHSIIIIPP
ncbi:MAG: hypothetical protein NTY91_03615 [Euryarchaeota archaeon]|nr:hypothetical protein [Euryarchaeota archaeon]